MNGGVALNARSWLSEQLAVASRPESIASRLATRTRAPFSDSFQIHFYQWLPPIVGAARYHSVHVSCQRASCSPRMDERMDARTEARMNGCSTQASELFGAPIRAYRRARESGARAPWTIRYIGYLWLPMELFGRRLIQLHASQVMEESKLIVVVACYLYLSLRSWSSRGKEEREPRISIIFAVASFDWILLSSVQDLSFANQLGSFCLTLFLLPELVDPRPSSAHGGSGSRGARAAVCWARFSGESRAAERGVRSPMRAHGCQIAIQLSHCVEMVANCRPVGGLLIDTPTRLRIVNRSVSVRARDSLIRLDYVIAATGAESTWPLHGCPTPVRARRATLAVALTAASGALIP